MHSKINFHTHSNYCDGKAPLRDFVERAIELGFQSLGFSGHAPVPFENNFAIKQEQYQDYCNEVRSLQTEYHDKIQLFLGLEIDYIPGILDDFKPLKEAGNLDYHIGSVHLVNRQDQPDNLWFIDGGRQETYDEGLKRVFEGDIRKGVTAFFHQTNRMIETQKPTIVGHFDKIVMHNRGRYFDYEERWVQNLIGETIELIRECGCIAEINSRGLYKGRHTDFYPAQSTIKKMNDKQIPVMVGSDAHHPDDLDRFEGAYTFLKEIEYKEVVYSLPLS